jgi:transcription initiation factor TFIIE subunit alpha
MGKKKPSRKNGPKKTKVKQKRVVKEKKHKVNPPVKGKKMASEKKKEEAARVSPVIEMLKRPNVRKLFIDVGGENAMEIIRLLTQYGEDEKIAEKLRVKVSDVRSVLNKFHNEGIVSYERTKDEETGWYYYNWRLNIERLNAWIEERMNADREFVLAKIREGEHYFCPKCKDIEMLMKFEEAADYNFKCPKCKTPMELLDEERVEKLIKNEHSRD